MERTGEEKGCEHLVGASTHHPRSEGGGRRCAKETRLRVEASEVQVCEMEERQGEGNRGVRPGNGARRR